MRARRPAARPPGRSHPAAGPAPHARRTRWWSRYAGPLGLAAGLLAVLAVHSPALHTFFAQDDLLFLLRARGLDPSPWPIARPLAGWWRWEASEALFGLDPLPYHLLALALHLANTALVWSIARRLAGPVGAAVASVLFGSTSIAFTPLHWASGTGELMAATGMLGSLALYLKARAQGSLAWAVASAAAFGAAMLSKETTITGLLVIAAAEWRTGIASPSARAMLPHAVVAALVALATATAYASGAFLGGAAYAWSLDPAALFRNLLTYAAWAVTPWVPVRDAVAAPQAGAMRAGVLALVATLGVVVWTRRARPRAAEIGAVWCLAFLLPVLPLLHHTYLYYLYLPWAGLCWIAAAAVRGVAGRHPALVAAATVLALAVVVADFGAVRARERAMTGNLPTDRTIRESRMLRNATQALDSADLAPGTRVAFVHPGARRPTALAAGETSFSYVPLEQVLGPGGGFALFFPELEYVGFSDSLPPDWEDAETFLFQDEGTMRSLGRGGRAQAALGTFTISTANWPRAHRMLMRALALGDTVPDALYGLVITSEFTGDLQASRHWAREFLARYPGDSRAPLLARELARAESSSAR
jgi:Dolichyl-phosphate-mannose-protein mannosyltransferase